MRTQPRKYVVHYRTRINNAIPSYEDKQIAVWAYDAKDAITQIENDSDIKRSFCYILCVRPWTAQREIPTKLISVKENEIKDAIKVLAGNLGHGEYLEVFPDPGDVLLVGEVGQTLGLGSDEIARIICRIPRIK